MIMLESILVEKNKKSPFKGLFFYPSWLPAILRAGNKQMGAKAR